MVYLLEQRAVLRAYPLLQTEQIILEFSSRQVAQELGHAERNEGYLNKSVLMIVGNHCKVPTPTFISK